MKLEKFGKTDRVTRIFTRFEQGLRDLAASKVYNREGHEVPVGEKAYFFNLFRRLHLSGHAEISKAVRELRALKNVSRSEKTVLAAVVGYCAPHGYLQYWDGVWIEKLPRYRGNMMTNSYHERLCQARRGF